jgi:hypothetical protein
MKTTTIKEMHRGSKKTKSIYPFIYGGCHVSNATLIRNDACPPVYQSAAVRTTNAIIGARIILNG